MNTKVDDGGAGLREAILTEFKQVLKLAPADYTENCTNVVMSLIKSEQSQLIDRLVEAVRAEKRPQVEGNKLPYINRGYTEGEVNGHNKALNQVTDILLNIKKEVGND